MKKELEGLYQVSGANQLGISIEEFAQLMDGLSQGQLGTDSCPSDRLKFYTSLHLKDLVFVRACVKGTEEAWATLINGYRAKLFRIACQITKKEDVARDLSDSLFADLFGIYGSRGGRLSSKLQTYSGRCSLEGWLRSLLAREFVNWLRRERKFVAFDEGLETSLHSEPDVEAKEQSPQLENALDLALSELNAEQRFLLAGYFLDGRTKSELAKMLAVHETTIGRQIAGALKRIRRGTIRHLCNSGLSLRAARELLASDVRSLNVNVRQRLLLEEA